MYWFAGVGRFILLSTNKIFCFRKQQQKPNCRTPRQRYVNVYAPLVRPHHPTTGPWPWLWASAEPCDGQQRHTVSPLLYIYIYIYIYIYSRGDAVKTHPCHSAAEKGVVISSML